MFVQTMKFRRFYRTSKSAKVSDLVYVCPLWRWREPQQVRLIPLRYGLYYTKIANKRSKSLLGILFTKNLTPLHILQMGAKSYLHHRAPPSRVRAWYVIRNIRIRVLLILISHTPRVCARTREDFFTTKWLPLRKNIRKLTPRLKKFALALKRVLIDVPGPENLHSEKIMKALKIKRRMYFLLRESLHKTLSKSAIYGGACD